MATGYTIAYLDWLANRAWNSATRPATFDVFLYNDSEDDPDLQAESDLSWLNTEPAGLNRHTFNFGSATVAADGNRADATFGDASFDLTDVSGTVDAFGITFVHDSSDLFVGSGLLDETTDLGDKTGTWTVECGADLYSIF